jgi:hypothetical protein
VSRVIVEMIFLNHGTNAHGRLEEHMYEVLRIILVIEVANVGWPYSRPLARPLTRNLRRSTDGRILRKLQEPQKSCCTYIARDGIIVQ